MVDMIPMSELEENIFNGILLREFLLFPSINFK